MKKKGGLKWLSWKWWKPIWIASTVLTWKLRHKVTRLITPSPNTIIRRFSFLRLWVDAYIHTYIPHTYRWELLQMYVGTYVLPRGCPRTPSPEPQMQDPKAGLRRNPERTARKWGSSCFKHLLDVDKSAHHIHLIQVQNIRKYPHVHINPQLEVKPAAHVAYHM